MSEMSLKKATTIYAAARYSSILIQMVLAAVMSRILTPDDYGIVAVVMVFTSFFEILSNLGLGTAVTQYQDLTKQDVQDLFTFSEYFSVALMLVFALAAMPIASFYGDPVYIPITLLLTVSVLFNALNMIPNALLMKENRFLLVGLRLIVVTFVSGGIAIGLALLGFKYYALVAQSILIAFFQFLWNFKGTYLKFKLRFSWAPIKKVKNFSAYQFGYNIMNYFSQNLDNILTGKLMGNEALAYYNKSYTLTRYPITNISHVITPVLHPVLARHQDDKGYIYQEFVKVCKFLSLVGVFIVAVCLWADTELIICYYGDQWYDAVAPFKWLSISIFFQLLNAMFGAIYQSLGCTKQMMQSGLIHVSVTLLAIVIGASTKDLTVLACLVSISFAVKFLVEAVFLIKKCFHFSVGAYLSNFIPEVGIFAVLYLMTVLIGDLEGMNLWVSLFVKTGILAVGYGAMVYMTKQYRYLFAVLPEKIKCWFRK